MSDSLRGLLAGTLLIAFGAVQAARAQEVSPQSQPKRADSTAKAKRQPADSGRRFEIYGFAQGDAIGDFNSNNPDWFDVNRPSKLPAFPDEFGHDGHSWLSARQSRFGTKAVIPTSNGPDINIVFDWDLFGVGPDAGQTTIRPRHMYGQWGNFGGGQTESPFMDLDAFPNVLDYWGPNGMLFYRNVQLFWQPVHHDNGTRVTIALERPGASGDAGVLADRIELQNIKPRFPAPDISGEWRLADRWGYFKLGAIVRWIRWDDVLPNDPLDLSGGTTAWGTSLSTGIHFGANDLLHLQTVFGAGVENYFNDAPIDVGAQSHNSPTRPVTGKALGDLGLMGYLDHKWSSHFSSSIGYSRVDIDNSDLQAGSAFKSGQYASVNIMWTPVPNVMAGGEYQYAHRDNKDGVFHADDSRLQFSLKYSFSQKFGGGTHEPVTAQ